MSNSFDNGNNSVNFGNLNRSKQRPTVRTSYLNDKDMLKIFDKADKNKNGNIDFSEFVEFNNDVVAYEKQHRQAPQTGVKSEKTYLSQGKQNAKDMYTPIYDSWTLGGCDEKSFQNALGRLNSNNVLQTLSEYKKLTNGTSLVQDIVDEKSDSNQVRKAAIQKVFGALVAKAEASGMDKNSLKTLKYQFETLMNKELMSFGIADAEGLDRIINGVVQGIENANNLSSEEKAQIKEQSVELQDTTVDMLTSKGSKALRSLNAQRDYDGWAGKTADYVSGLWGSDNRYDKVLGDVQKYQSQAQELKAASNKGPEEFKAKFQQIFGVEYDPVQVAAYQKKEQTYIVASKEYAKEMYAKENLGKLASSEALSDEYAVHTTSYGATMSSLSASKKDVYNREFNRFAELLGQGDKAKGTETLNNALKNQDLENASLDEKYACLSKMAKAVVDEYHQKTTQATGGKTFEQISDEYNNSYAATFGTENDIARRVAKYNASQEAGAAVVKGGTVTAISVVATIATAGAASPLIVGAISGGASFAVDMSDELSSTTRREELGTDASNQRIAKYAGKAIINGLAAGVSEAGSTALEGVTNTMAPVTKVATETAFDVSVDIAQDAAVQLVNNGEIDGSLLLKSALTSTVVNTAIRGGKEFINSRSTGAQLAAALDEAVENADDLEIQAKLQNGIQENTRVQYSYQEAIDNAVDFNGKPVSVNHSALNAQSGLEAGVVRRTVDIPEADARAIHQKTTNLLGNGANSNFANGIEALQARIIADNAGTLEGTLEQGATVLTQSKASTMDAFTQNPRAMVMQLDEALPQDCARMAANAYSGKVADPAKMNGFTQVSEVSGNNGFAAKAYVKDDVVVVAFRGSDDLSDLVVDHSMLSGKLPEQFQNAKNYLEQIKQQYPDAKIVTTGHSLGGTLAELTASADPSIVGVTFDAVGTKGLIGKHAAQGLADNSNVTAYVVKNDIISNTSAHIGRTSAIDAAQNPRATGSTPVHYDEHAIGNFSSAKTWATFQSNENELLTGLQSKFAVREGHPANGRVYTDGSSAKVNLLDADGSIVNKQLLDLGFTDAPFTPGREARIITTTKDMTFVRTLDGENSGVLGSWLMTKADLEGLTPQQIADKWALPQIPRFVCDVEVPAGTQIRVGECNPIFGFQGGGTQYQLVERISMGNYDNVRRIVSQ